jgi:predicted ATPase with chaperone activity
VQAERYVAIGLPQIRTNAAASSPELDDVARPDASGLTLLRDAADAMRLSARRYHRVLRVARALAYEVRRARKAVGLRFQHLREPAESTAVQAGGLPENGWRPAVRCPRSAPVDAVWRK